MTSIGKLLIVGLALVSAAVACGQPTGHDDDFADALYDALEGVDPGGVVDIADDLDLTGNRIVLMGAGHSDEDVVSALGFAWTGYRQDSLDEGTLVLVIHDGAVTRWVRLPEMSAASTGRLVQFVFDDQFYIDVDPNDMRFEISHVQPDGPIEACYQACP